MTIRNYKDTLNLPKTDFPMKANLSQREPEILRTWEESQIYSKIRHQRSQAKKFILHDGPPYANGHLHCGHALNKILKDIIIKEKTLSGFDAPYIPGWDCHGLPIELNVEKKVGKAGHKISAAKFRSQCRAYGASQINLQREEFKRLGVFGDWDNYYATFDYQYEANIIRALGKIIANGHIEQGFKPVHWCIDCGSALAEAEVEYEDKTSLAIDVAFYAVQPQDVIEKFASKSCVLISLKPVIIPIWTTTAWTLPANAAVCLHPELNYSLLEQAQCYYLVATMLVDVTMGRYGCEILRTYSGCSGRDFDKILLRHPLYGARVVPIVLGEHVTTDLGTGCVHTAPAHGPDDYHIGLIYGLEYHNPVQANGCYAADVETFAGVSVLRVNELIVNVLQNNHTLLHQELINHSYPHCWRHKTPMIFLTTPQWFVSMDVCGLRKAIFDQLPYIQWIPEWGKNRMQSMVDNRPDW